MARSLLDIVEEHGEPSVQLAPLSWRGVFIEDRRKQRMCEAHALSDLLDHPRGGCIGQRGTDSWRKALEQGHGRPRQRGGGENERARGGTEPCHPPADELAYRPRHGERLVGCWLDSARLQFAPDLEREEGVAARRLVQPDDRRARRVETDAGEQELVQGADGERREAETEHAIVAQRPFELELAFRFDSPRRQHEDGLLAQAP
jgi:hypothetical protein